VLPRPNGWVEASVLKDRSAARLPKDLELQIRMPTRKGSLRSVQLQWDPLRGFYAGAMGGEDRPAPGAITATIRTQGKTHRGATPFGAVIPTARFGGIVVAVDNHAIEVLPYRNGRIEAIPVSGQVSLAHYAQMDLVVGVESATGDPHAVQMKWEVKYNRFIGRTKTGVRLRGGPLDVTLSEKGVKRHGGISMVAALPSPSIEGQVIISGNHTVEVRKSGGRRIDANIRDMNGQEPPPHKVQLILNVVDVEGASYPIPMAWDAALGIYVGYVYTPLDKIASLTTRVRTGVEDISKPFGQMQSWMGSASFDFPHAKSPSKAEGKRVAAAPKGRNVKSGTARPINSRQFHYERFRPGTVTEMIRNQNEADSRYDSAGRSPGSVEAGGSDRGDISSGLSPGIN